MASKHRYRATSQDIVNNCSNNNNEVSVQGSTLKRSDSQLFVDITNKDGVPSLFHELHIHFGFRRRDHPWFCYLFSIFQLHNETLNVWTHLIALIIVIYKTWLYSYKMDFFNDPYLWPFVLLIVTTSTLYTFSSLAHCFHNKSELWHYTCFMIDYTGIAFHCFGSTVAHFYYSTENDFYYKGQYWFVGIGAVMSICACLCCCAAKVFYAGTRALAPKLLNLTSVALTYVWLVLPLIHQIYNCAAHNIKCDESVPLHFGQIAWMSTGAFFYGSGLPQKLYPGAFDIFGHGHQIFHICVILTTYCQLEAVLIDIQAEHVDIRSRPTPTVLDTFGYALAVFLCEVLIVKLMKDYITQKLKKDNIERN